MIGCSPFQAEFYSQIQRKNNKIGWGVLLIKQTFYTVDKVKEKEQEEKQNNNSENRGRETEEDDSEKGERMKSCNIQKGSANRNSWT